jgi:hypothetical protein
MRTIFLAALLIAILPSFAFAATADTPAPPRLDHVSDAAGLLAAVAKQGGNRTILLDPGTYELTAILRFEKVNHVSLLGTGWNTVIVKRGPGPAIEFVDASFCIVRDLMFVGYDKADAAIIYRGQSSSCTIDHCRMALFARSGVRYEGVPDRPMSSNTVRDCQFIRNAEAQLYSLCNNDFYITGNQFGTDGDAPKYGAQLVRSSAGNYSANYHWGNTVALQLGPGSNFNRIENNRLEESLHEALIIGSPDPSPGWDGYSTLNIILGNTFHTNSKAEKGRYSVVVAYDATDTTFCANQVFSWDSGTVRHRSALELLRGCSSWIVKDNIFRHHMGPALVFDHAACHLVRDNIGAD